MALPLTGPNGEPVIVVNIDPARQSRLVTEAKKLEAEFKRQLGKGGFIEETNRVSLERIQNQAAKNLRTSMKANRRPDFNSGRLERAIRNPKYSAYSATELQFFVRDKIFPDVPYYASLEFGDDSQVGKERWFTFKGARKGATNPNYRTDHRRNFNRVHKPSDIRNNRRPGELGKDKYGNRRQSVTFGGPGRVSDRIIGPREYKSRLGKSNEFSDEGRVRVIIRRPVPRYAYGTKAGDLFLSSRGYRSVLDDTSAAWRAKYGIGVK